ncbi:hypothetical protein FVB9288_01049 [Flavobacterium sp. CECT 9288]|uniref:hypothetical protein n=1 Tax=Flavobacterium sp. CECT 9288 TaxID=2845819 RepID=UPI001E38EE4D|nr:hypothetical protein [Flavobacterium sp. CECT 9288]CAH0335408.1 hypothetical protein FVB9288_01049 [Flavobacterium sp. CECT 9288]
MRKIIIALVLIFSTNSFSQDMYDIIGKETCACLGTKKLDYQKLDKKELQTQVGLCMIQSYTSHINEFKQEDKIQFDDQEGMRKMGEKVALKMLVNCPEIILELGKSTQKDIGDESEDELVVDEPADVFIEGQVTAIKKDQFVSLLVKDKNGRAYSFLLLDYFETASVLTNNELKVKDSVKVGYTEIELFDVATNEFKYFKILTDIQRQ